MGVFLALCIYVCSVCVCVNAGFIASGWAWLHGPALGHRCLVAIGGRVPEAVVTFEPREEDLGAWQEVKGEAVSVNEALYAGVIERPYGWTMV